MNKKALVLFSAGKDSSMALDWTIKNNYSCEALIATNSDNLLQHCDGPEINVSVAKFIAEYIFNVPAKPFLTHDDSYKEDILREVEKQIINSNPEVVITGDLNHPDGMINFLRKKLENKYPKTNFISIGELYTTKNDLDYGKYMSDVLKNLRIIFSGIRMPAFKNCSNIVGKSFTPKTIYKLKELGIDTFGEDGVYQSLCVGVKKSPNFVSITDFTTQTFTGRDIKGYKYNIMGIKKYGLIVNK